jgi:hypothetical protein
MTEEDEIVVNWQPGFEDEDTPPATWHDEPPSSGSDNWETWEDE